MFKITSRMNNHTTMNISSIQMEGYEKYPSRVIMKDLTFSSQFTFKKLAKNVKKIYIYKNHQHTNITKAFQFN